MPVDPGTAFNIGSVSKVYVAIAVTLLVEVGKIDLDDPGAMAVSCNDGFALAEMVEERVGGQKYIDSLASRIFEPLGLNHTGASVGERAVRAAAAEVVAAYYRPATGQREPFEAVSFWDQEGSAPPRWIWPVLRTASHVRGDIPCLSRRRALRSRTIHRF